MSRTHSFISRFIFLSAGLLSALLLFASQSIQASYTAAIANARLSRESGMSERLLAQANQDNSAENSVELIIRDMQGQHESRLKGVPDSFNWSRGPRISAGNNPGTFKALTGWGVVNEAAGGNSAPNTRVEIDEVRTYLLRKSNDRWLTVQNSIPVGAAFREDFKDNINVAANVRQEPQGTISVKAGNGFNFHFWPRNRVEINPNDIAGIVVTFRARLIVDNPNRADDRGSARYLALAGADYWTSMTARWNYFQTNKDAAIGKAKFVTREWKYFNMTTASLETLRNNPPPLE